VVLQVRRAAEGRVLESVSVLLPAGHERLVTVVPAWVRGKGLGPAAEALARMIAARGIPVPAVLAESAAPSPVADRSRPRGFAWAELVESPAVRSPQPAAAQPADRSARLAAVWSDRPVAGSHPAAAVRGRS
jgi:hypothetical protein